MRRAYAEPTAENFHEWRKRVKYHLYHVRLVQPAWAPVLAAREEELDALGDLLGDAHDLVVLEQLLSSDEIDLEPRARELLAGVCQSQRRRLEQRARPSGERLFAESPKAIGRRMRSYVRTWREAA